MHGAWPDVRCKSGLTALHVACREGHLATVAVLATCHRANLNIKNKVGQTPLALAAAKVGEWT